MKTFSGDFDKFLNKIKSGEHFSLSRWGDGELTILEGKPIDIRSKGNGEFRYDPNMPQYNQAREKLLESYVYKDDQYYIGIACPCCVGQEKFEYMRTKSGQDEDHLTWANIFVNANYRRTVNELIPEFKNHSITLVVNQHADTDGLSFTPHRVLRVGTDAWYEDFDIGRDMLEQILMRNVKDEIFLIAAGPLANILTYSLWVLGSKNNTYIDIGSILDPYLQLKLTRGYHLGAPTLNKVCIWK
jgi:hypothetical protein